VAVCSPGALELFSSGLKIEHGLCTLCEDCITFCPTGALRLEGTGDPAYASAKQIPRQENGP
jgi:ferredoxin